MLNIKDLRDEIIRYVSSNPQISVKMLVVELASSGFDVSEDFCGGSSWWALTALLKEITICHTVAHQSQFACDYLNHWNEI